jgi:hypothetical protein
VLPIASPPAIETARPTPKIPASLTDIANLVREFKHPQLVIHIAPEFVHPIFLPLRLK